MLGTFIYLLKQGFENVWKNKLMFVASVLIISTSMITLGVFTIVGENAKHMVEKIKADQVILTLLKEDITDSQIKSVEETISEINGVKNIKFESKEEALKQARDMYFTEENVDLTAGWEENNLFSDSFSVYVDDLDSAKGIADKVATIEGVRKVSFDNDMFVKINKVADIIKAVFFVIFILLIAVSLLVISNTIKLVLHSRRKEINIMKYIGATDSFVKFPFIIEGIIVGVVGAVLSWLLTIELYGVLKSFVTTNVLAFEYVELSSRILYTNLIIGIGISCTACIISIKKYLQV